MAKTFLVPFEVYQKERKKNQKDFSRSQIAV